MLRIVVVHLNFENVGTGSRDVVNNGVGQSSIVRADGCNDDLHTGSSELLETVSH